MRIDHGEGTMEPIKVDRGYYLVEGVVEDGGAPESESHTEGSQVVTRDEAAVSGGAVVRRFIESAGEEPVRTQPVPPTEPNDVDPARYRATADGFYCAFACCWRPPEGDKPFDIKRRAKVHMSRVHGRTTEPIEADRGNYLVEGVVEDEGDSKPESQNEDRQVVTGNETVVSPNTLVRRHLDSVLRDEAVHTEPAPFPKPDKGNPWWYRAIVDEFYCAFALCERSLAKDMPFSTRLSAEDHMASAHANATGTPVGIDRAASWRSERPQDGGVPELQPHTEDMQMVSPSEFPVSRDTLARHHMNNVLGEGTVEIEGGVLRSTVLRGYMDFVLSDEIVQSRPALSTMPDDLIEALEKVAMVAEGYDMEMMDTTASQKSADYTTDEAREFGLPETVESSGATFSDGEDELMTSEGMHERNPNLFGKTEHERAFPKEISAVHSNQLMRECEDLHFNIAHMASLVQLAGPNLGSMPISQSTTPCPAPREAEDLMTQFLDSMPESRANQLKREANEIDLNGGFSTALGPPVGLDSGPTLSFQITPSPEPPCTHIAQAYMTLLQSVTPSSAPRTPTAPTQIIPPSRRRRHNAFGAYLEPPPTIHRALTSLFQSVTPSPASPTPIASTRRMPPPSKERLEYVRESTPELPRGEKPGEALMERDSWRPRHSEHVLQTSSNVQVHLLQPFGHALAQTMSNSRAASIEILRFVYGPTSQLPSLTDAERLPFEFPAAGQQPLSIGEGYQATPSLTTTPLKGQNIIDLNDSNDSGTSIPDENYRTNIRDRIDPTDTVCSLCELVVARRELEEHMDQCHRDTIRPLCDLVFKWTELREHLYYSCGDEKHGSDKVNMVRDALRYESISSKWYPTRIAMDDIEATAEVIMRGGQQDETEGEFSDVLQQTGTGLEVSAANPQCLDAEVETYSTGQDIEGSSASAFTSSQSASSRVARRRKHRGPPRYPTSLPDWSNRLRRRTAGTLVPKDMGSQDTPLRRNYHAGVPCLLISEETEKLNNDLKATDAKYAKLIEDLPDYLHGEARARENKHVKDEMSKKKSVLRRKYGIFPRGPYKTDARLVSNEDSGMEIAPHSTAVSARCAPAPVKPAATQARETELSLQAPTIPQASVTPQATIMPDAVTIPQAPTSAGILMMPRAPLVSESMMLLRAPMKPQLMMPQAPTMLQGSMMPQASIMSPAPMMPEAVVKQFISATPEPEVEVLKASRAMRGDTIKNGKGFPASTTDSIKQDDQACATPPHSLGQKRKTTTLVQSKESRPSGCQCNGRFNPRLGRCVKPHEIVARVNPRRSSFETPQETIARIAIALETPAAAANIVRQLIHLPVKLQPGAVEPQHMQTPFRRSLGAVKGPNCSSDCLEGCYCLPMGMVVDNTSRYGRDGLI